MFCVVVGERGGEGEEVMMFCSWCLSGLLARAVVNVLVFMLLVVLVYFVFRLVVTVGMYWWALVVQGFVMAFVVHSGWYLADVWMLAKVWMDQKR